MTGKIRNLKRRGQNEISWIQMATFIVATIGVFAGFAYWLVPPKYLQQKIGLVPKDPYVSLTNDPHLDDVTAKALRKLGHVDYLWVSLYGIRAQQRKGWDFVLTGDRRQIAFVGVPQNGALDQPLLMYKKR